MGRRELTKPYAWGKPPAKRDVHDPLLKECLWGAPQPQRRTFMIKNILSAALAAGIAFSVAGSAAYAAATPKTKAACEKVKTMKWDEATSKCVKK
jgi:hypothetical protein